MVLRRFEKTIIMVGGVCAFTWWFEIRDRGLKGIDVKEPAQSDGSG